MSFSENTSDSDWKNAKGSADRRTSIKNSSKNKPKYNQRFCEKWLNVFEPWLERSSDDPDKPFCKVCVCRLDCNRCHLVRHQSTTKHKRNLDAFIGNGEGAARKEVRVRQERSKYYQQRKRALQQLKKEEAGSRVIDEKVELPEEPYDLLVSEANRQLNASPLEAESEAITPLHPPEDFGLKQTNGPAFQVTATKSSQDGIKLLKQIHQDKNELMESFRELMGSQSTYHPPNPPREKNHVDLFFESVSSSVKALTPKLIAEAKMRVSQLICELELRSLTENNSTNEDIIEVPVFKTGVTITKQLQPHYGGPS
ncbi:protein suppressor of variegation 3-7-like [Drosophila tropicalis]|uniref:protein suppressor of variegation 3-7-like n=1 Tax=Drosophila tropicalis TaxID=46794 RepID=UPI0035ABABA6